MFIHWLIVSNIVICRFKNIEKLSTYCIFHLVSNLQHHCTVYYKACLQLCKFPPFPSLSCLLLQVQCFAQKFAKKVAETIENQQLSRQYPVVLYIKLERFNCSLLKAVIRILVLQIISIFQTKFSKITSLCVVFNRAESEHNTAIAPSLLHLLLSVAVSDWLTAYNRAVCHLARGQRPEVTRVKN
ncbi:hypothetical protein T4B_2466 [Trichinella pseudospiralis]|uniref:Uncharacterized protein n=1 Tax=Trichinella pseudospiralis TaxID=6337 RepID=A0A0V1IYQ5_TRIPS|nr:hypothetical protein T4B_2466 [Trichinella pseudospiralis]